MIVESMLTTPGNLFLHLLDDDLQNELFHHLSWDGGKADWPVVPWVPLLALSEDWSDTGFSPVRGHFFCPGPFRDDGMWLSNDICQLMTSSVPNHFVHVLFFILWDGTWMYSQYA